MCKTNYAKKNFLNLVPYLKTTSNVYLKLKYSSTIMTVLTIIHHFPKVGIVNLLDFLSRINIHVNEFPHSMHISIGITVV